MKVAPLIERRRQPAVERCVAGALAQWPGAPALAAADLCKRSIQMAVCVPAQAWVLASAAMRMVSADPMGLADSQRTLATILNELGEFHAALPLLATASAIYQALNKLDLAAVCSLEALRAQLELRQHNAAAAAAVTVDQFLVRQPHPLLQARAARLAARLHHYRREQPAALEAAHRAVALAEQMADDLEVAQARLELARVLFAVDPKQAQALTLEAEHSFVQAGRWVDAAHARHFRGLALEQLNQYPAALALYATNRSFYLAEAMEHYVAWTDNMRCVLFWRLERYDEAVAAGEEACAYFAGRRIEVWQAMCDNNLAIVRYSLHQLDRAASLYAEAADICRSEEMVLDEAMCRVNLGLVQAETGRFDLALLSTQRAQSLFVQGNLHAAAADCEQNLARLLLKLGRPDEAMVSLQAACARFVQQGRTIDVALANAQLAELWLALERPADALPVAERSWQTLADAGMHHHAALARRLCGVALVALQRRAEGVADLHLAYAHFRAHGLAVDAAMCELDLGECLLEDPLHREMAESHLRAALAVLDPALPGEAWRAWAGLGRCAQMRGDLAGALEHTLAALHLVGTVRAALPTERWSSSFFAAQARLYRDGLATALAQRAFGQALAIAEASKTQTFVGQIGVPVGPLITDDPYVQHLQEQEAKLRLALDALQGEMRLAFQQGAEPTATAAQLSTMRTQSAAYEAVIDALRVAQPRVGLALAPAGFDLHKLRQTFARQASPWACLSYHREGDQLLIFYVDASRLRTYRVQLSAYDRLLLRQATDPSAGYRELVYGARILGQRAPQPHLRHLYHLLMPAEVQELTADHVLYLAPHGVLHALPFAALDSGAGRLLERTQLVYAPSLAALQRLLAVAPKGVWDHPALVCGVEDFHGRAAALLAAPAEVAGVMALLGERGDLLWGDAATREGWLAMNQSGVLSRYGLIHVAAHARLEPGAPARAAVLLADGALTVYDILNLRLLADGVVLSACNSASGQALGGNELMSLAWAWLQAGASTVVASLWPVADAATAVLMQAFYRHLLAPGSATASRPVAQALRAAQLQLARAGAPVADWAAWVVIGAG